MDYIVFDLEFNQFYKANENRQEPEKNFTFEIVQIGAVKLNSNFEMKARFNKLIKPQVYKDLHPFVEKLTNLNEEELNRAEPFDHVFEDFLAFIGDKRNILVVWGMVDLQVFYRNITYYGREYEEFPKEYINLQKYAAEYLNAPKGKNIGLKNAITLLEIDENLDYHHALHDAIYTSEIFRKIYSNHIETDIYNPIKKTENSERNKSKRVLNEKKLIQQFEKMKGDKLSKEEIQRIILAYKMGATQQFLEEE